jgi:hypothetical protein
MKTIKEQGYTISICTDFNEWVKEFYEIAEGCIVMPYDQDDKECMGFAEITEKEIWVFLPKDYSLKDLKETVAHEIGHIIEMEHPTNPPEDAADELHELKADHYMNFFMLVDKIVERIIDK